MFEARFATGPIFKKIVDSIKDLVTDTNLECAAGAITLQAMDSSHVALVALSLKSEGFDLFRCDRNISLGMNLGNVAKILKCAGNDDTIAMKAEDDGDTVSFTFESEDNVRTSNFEMKLMDIDSEHLGIPETDYKVIVKMPSAEFQRIVRDLGVLGDTCTISVSKEGVRFSVNGDLGTGNIVRKQNTASEKADDRTTIEMEEPVELTFALQYLNSFTKATPLSATVALNMSKEVPLMVEYKIENLGFVRFYLAPKIDEANE